MFRTVRSGPVLRRGFLPAVLLLACAAGGQAAGRADLDEAGHLARQILNAAEVRGGLVVHLGCGDGRITAALRAGEGFLVHGIDADPAVVAAAQEHIDAQGLYGPVSVECRSDSALPYADNLVNLLVVSQNEGGVSSEEMLRVLAPEGVALVSGSNSESTTPGDEQTAARRVEIGGKPWHVIRKPWPAEIDEWTHWLHGPDGNPVAADRVVGLPRRAQWVAEPRWSRSHEKSPSLTGMVSAKGRLFYICDEAPPSLGGPLPDQWRLVARDAFSGVLLWKRPVGDWGWQAWSPSEPLNFRWGNPRFIHRRLVAVGDRVYVTLGYSDPVSALDAATGELVRVYQGTENTCEVLCHDGLLVLSAATEPKTATDRSPPLKIMAVEAATGRLAWEAGPFPSLFDLGERGKASVLKSTYSTPSLPIKRKFSVALLR